MRGKLINGATIVTLLLSGHVAAQSQTPPVATFKAAVDMVRIAAVVRDSKGRFVQDLTARDFEVLDGGQTRPISDLQRELTGVSVACSSTSAAAWKGTCRTRGRRPLTS